MANRFSIETVFSGVDKISKPVDRMQSSVKKFTRSMTNGLRKANRAVNKVVKSLGRGAKSIAKWGATAAAAGLLATTLALNNMADSADALAKQSRRMQFPIEQFQQWQFVAEQSGFTVEQFNKSAEGMNKRLGELKAGTGSLFTFLNKTDKAFMNQLSSVNSSSKALDMLIRKMQATKDPAKQAALANAAFGRSGLKMSNIAELGADRIKQLMLEQKQNGIVTKEQAENAESYNDAISSLKRSILGFMQSALLPMLPTLTRYAREFRNFIVEHKDDVINRMRNALEKLKPAIKNIWDQVKQFNKDHGIIEFFGKALESGTRFMSWLLENGSTMVTVAKWVGGLVIGLNILTSAFTLFNLVMAANPVVLALMGIVAAITFAVVYFDEIVEAIQGTGNWLEVLFGVMMLAGGPVGVLVGAAGLVVKHWDAVKDTLSSVVEWAEKAWDSVAGFFGDEKEAKVRFTATADTAIFDQIDAINQNVGYVSDDSGTRAANDPARPQVVSPQDRIISSLQERRDTTEVTIKDETGRAEITRGRNAHGLKLQSTGGV